MRETIRVPNTLNLYTAKNLDEFQTHVYSVAAKKGWWVECGVQPIAHDESDAPLPPPANRADVERLIPEKLDLIHSEIVEADDAESVGRFFIPIDDKPEGVVAEFADVAIRAFDLCGALASPIGALVVDAIEEENARIRRAGVHTTDFGMFIRDAHRLTARATEAYRRGGADDLFLHRMANLVAHCIRVECVAPMWSAAFSDTFFYAMQEKHRYNQTRSFRHGNKRC